MSEIHSRCNRAAALVTALEEKEHELSKMATKKKATVSLQRRLIEVRCDLSYRRRTLAELRIQALGAEVAERREAYVMAKAAGSGEEEAEALRAAEEALSDPETLLAPQVFDASYALLCREWSEHVREHHDEMLAEHEAHGEQILSVVRDCRARLADAAERWKALDAALFWSERRGYATGTRGSGGIPDFPGADGPLLPAVPRSLTPAPTMVATTGASVGALGVPVEVIA